MRAKNEIREKENFLSDPTRKKNLPGFEKKSVEKRTDNFCDEIFFADFFSADFGSFLKKTEIFWKWMKWKMAPDVDDAKKSFFFNISCKKAKFKKFGFWLLLKQTQNCILTIFLSPMSS